jgi:hypothetical protein
MTTITLQPATTVEIDTANLVLTKITDSPTDLVITATIQNIWRDIILWKGAEEYADAGIWTNETANARAVQLIDAGIVKFV